MILVDTSVWIEHLRRGVPEFARSLDAGEVLGHPIVIGELASGNLADRATCLADLQNLPRAVVATDAEALALIEREALHGLGIGYADVCLLASARLTPDARLWTRDRRLADVAARLRVASHEG